VDDNGKIRAVVAAVPIALYFVCTMCVSFNVENESLYFFLNFYQVLAIANQGLAFVATLILCLFLWMITWAVLSMLKINFVKKDGEL
jgi:hypothetical protein